MKKAAAGNPDFSWTAVANDAYLDWGLEQNFLLNWKEGKPEIYDGGNVLFSATTLSSVGQAIVGVLTHPGETRDRYVYVKDIDLTQNQLLEMAKEIDPGKEWDEPIQVDTAELEKSADQKVARGVFDGEVINAYLFRAIFGPPEYGALLQTVDNELLGVKGMTKADVKDLFKKIMLG